MSGIQENPDRIFGRRALLGGFLLAPVFAACSTPPDKQIDTKFGQLSITFKKDGGVIVPSSGYYELEIPKRRLTTIPVFSQSMDLTYIMTNQALREMYVLEQDIANHRMIIVVQRFNAGTFRLINSFYQITPDDQPFNSQWNCDVQAVDHTVGHTLWAYYEDWTYTKAGWDAVTIVKR